MTPCERKFMFVDLLHSDGQNANTVTSVPGLFIAQFEPLVRFEFSDCTRLFGVTIIPVNMRTNARFMLHYCRDAQVCTSLKRKDEQMLMMCHRQVDHWTLLMRI